MVEVADLRAALLCTASPFQTPDGPSALHPRPRGVRLEADVDDVARVDLASARWIDRVLDYERPGHRVGADCPHEVRGAGGTFDSHEAASRHLPAGPADRVEAAHSKRSQPDVEAGEERVEQRFTIDRLAGDLPERRYRLGDLRREIRRRPVRAQADPDDREGVARAEAVGLAKDIY